MALFNMRPGSPTPATTKTGGACSRSLWGALAFCSLWAAYCRRATSRLAEAKQILRAEPRESFDEFQFNWNVDVAFIVRVSQKFADSRASDPTIILRKLIHVHADEFTGELRAHVARVGERMAHCLVSMRQAVIDAFTNNFAEIVP